MNEKIEILIKTEDTETSVSPSGVCFERFNYLRRQIYIDGKLVYEDKLTPKKAFADGDKISDFYNWLNDCGRYGGNVSRNRKNTLGKCRAGFFRRIGDFFQIVALRFKKFYLQRKLFFLQRRYCAK